MSLIYNTRVMVVDLIRADTPEDAIVELQIRLARKGFDAFDSIHDIAEEADDQGIPGL